MVNRKEKHKLFGFLFSPSAIFSFVSFFWWVKSFLKYLSDNVTRKRKMNLFDKHGWEITEKNRWTCSGVANPQPRKKFLRPKLESRISDFLIVFGVFLQFFVIMRPKKPIILAKFSSCRLETSLGWPPLGLFIINT